MIGAEYIDPEPHRHLASHLLIGLYGNVNYVINGETISCGGVYVNSNVRHTVVTKDEAVIVFLFDNTTLLAEKIDQLLNHEPYKSLDSDAVTQIRHLYETYPPERNYTDFWERFIKTIHIDLNPVYSKDERIKIVLDLIGNMEEIKKGTIDWLAKNVYLSKSRLSHLFKEQTGISLASYLAIAKMIKTYKYLQGGISLTEACLRAGFNSSAHFSATNSRMFGLAPSHVLKDAKIYLV